MNVREFQKALKENGIVATAEQIRVFLRKQPAINTPNWYFVEAFKENQKTATK